LQATAVAEGGGAEPLDRSRNAGRPFGAAVAEDRSARGVEQEVFIDPEIAVSGFDDDRRNDGLEDGADGEDLQRCRNEEKRK
jgi:hypothetical protein